MVISRDPPTRRQGLVGQQLSGVEQLVDPGNGQAGPQFVEPAVEGLLAVRDDGDGPDPARVAVGDGRVVRPGEVATAGYRFPR